MKQEPKTEDKFDALVRKKSRDDLVNSMTEMIPVIAMLGVTGVIAYVGSDRCNFKEEKINVNKKPLSF